MSRCATLLAASILLVVAAGAGPAAAQAGKQLNFNDNLWPPYFVDEGGLAREILDVCMPATGFTPRFSAVTVEQLFPAMQNGVLDGHVMSRSADREKYVEYGSEALFHDSYHPIVREGSGIRVSSLQDLDKLRLGHLTGVRYSPEFLEYVRTRRDAGKLVEAKTNEEVLRLLVDGKIDVVVNLASSTVWLASRMNVRDRIEILPYEIKTSDYFLALSRTSKRVTDRPRALAAFDGCLAAMKRDGRYRRLLEKYDLLDAQP